MVRIMALIAAASERLKELAELRSAVRKTPKAKQATRRKAA